MTPSSLLILQGRISRHSDNGQIPEILVLAQQASCRVTIHNGHMDIHQDAVKVPSLKQIKGFLTVLRDFNNKAFISQLYH